MKISWQWLGIDVEFSKDILILFLEYMQGNSF